MSFDFASVSGLGAKGELILPQRQVARRDFLRQD
jgi:hypothetical protein